MKINFIIKLVIPVPLKFGGVWGVHSYGLQVNWAWVKWTCIAQCK